MTSCISDAMESVELPHFSTNFFDYDSMSGVSIIITTRMGDFCHVIHHDKMLLAYVCHLLSLLCTMLLSSTGQQIKGKNKTYAVHHVMPCLLVNFASHACIHDRL